MDEKNRPSAKSVWDEYEKSVAFKNQIGLYETVEVNENFFIGKQWEGVQNNGLPTPVFNFLKRVVLFQVASILSDNIKMQASPLAIAAEQKLVEQVAEVVTNEFEALFEHNKVGSLLREFMRNAAVDGDGCTYTYWNPDAEVGQLVKGKIETEVIENTRVHFGNPNDRRVQRQPYIIIESREMLESVKKKAKKNGVSTDAIKPDTDAQHGSAEKLTDGRVTVLLRLWRDDSGEIWGCETVKDVCVRKPWNLGIRLYPVTWLNWDYVRGNYHGMSMITGLIPNQIFVNKTFAMVQLSLMQSAFPKVVFDKTRIAKWTNQAGAAIGINGGDVSAAAKIIEPAQISPQVAQFIQSTIDYTQTFLGATSAAMGDARPDNTSAIIALQRASAVPSELTKQDLYQCVEDLGNIYVEFMTANYGTRTVKAPTPDLSGLPIAPPETSTQTLDFDFSTLRDMPMSLKLDVGASSYWSEVTSMMTLDNLLMRGKIELVDYLERIPNGQISEKQKLIDKIKQAQSAATGAAGGGGGVMPQQQGPPVVGNETLQRAIVQGMA